MRLNIQYIVREHIIGMGAVQAFLYACIHNLKLGTGFHPDTSFDNYIFIGGKRDGKDMFTEEEAEELNKTLVECFVQCTKNRVDIYELALKITKTTSLRTIDNL